MTTPNPESSGPPLRALAMVLIALAILFAGLGAASLGSSDSGDAAPEAAPTTTSAPAVAPVRTTTTAAPTTTAAETTTAASATSSVSTTTSARVDKSVPVRVFNNSTVSGLAAQTANELTSNGWDISETGNYSYGQIQTTTVYYGSSASEKAAAQAIAAELGVKAEPRFAGIASASPGVIVIVTSG
ncbi:LytR family transcriptional regulator [Rhodococcus sp. ABRD24]|uniref:LytR C-terminal domain-containing protein n=1 Tax=Rhodococcus sp. ABRD24 TaxID=2507582 RepID=UPI0010397035|nr:LytR C-terminal domain-containing protein [Rhodococcus sp. ABRD24]QBJ95827.1 LytR family transcriptional regulator [Rhodococcus sp. ABRD24]